MPSCCQLQVPSWCVARRDAQTYGCNLLCLLASEGPTKLLCDGQEVCLGGLNVEKREGCWSVANHQVGHGLQPDVVWL